MQIHDLINQTQSSTAPLKRNRKATFNEHVSVEVHNPAAVPRDTMVAPPGAVVPVVDVAVAVDAVGGAAAVGPPLRRPAPQVAPLNSVSGLTRCP